MRTISKIFAVILAIIAAVAFYGAAFCGASWHYGTTVLCVLLSTILAADGANTKTDNSSRINLPK